MMSAPKSVDSPNYNFTESHSEDEDQMESTIIRDKTKKNSQWSSSNPALNFNSTALPYQRNDLTTTTTISATSSSSVASTLPLPVRQIPLKFSRHASFNSPNPANEDLYIDTQEHQLTLNGQSPKQLNSNNNSPSMNSNHSPLGNKSKSFTAITEPKYSINKHLSETRNEKFNLTANYTNSTRQQKHPSVIGPITQSYCVTPVLKGSGLNCYTLRVKQSSVFSTPIYSLYDEESDTFIMMAQKSSDRYINEYYFSMNEGLLVIDGVYYVGKLIDIDNGGNKFEILEHTTSSTSSAKQMSIHVTSSTSKMRKIKVVVPKPTAAGNDAAASASPLTDQTRSNVNVNANVIGFHPTNNQKDSDDFITFISKMASELRNENNIFVLEYSGRKVELSTKNFILYDYSDDMKTTMVQFGKIDSSKYSLDFRYPLSPFQAFAIAISALECTVPSCRIRSSPNSRQTSQESLRLNSENWSKEESSRLTRGIDSLANSFDKTGSEGYIQVESNYSSDSYENNSNPHLVRNRVDTSNNNNTTTSNTDRRNSQSAHEKGRSVVVGGGSSFNNTYDRKADNSQRGFNDSLKVTKNSLEIKSASNNSTNALRQSQSSLLKQSSTPSPPSTAMNSFRKKSQIETSSEEDFEVPAHAVKSALQPSDHGQKSLSQSFHNLTKLVVDSNRITPNDAIYGDSPAAWTVVQTKSTSTVEDMKYIIENPLAVVAKSIGCVHCHIIITKATAFGNPTYSLVSTSTRQLMLSAQKLPNNRNYDYYISTSGDVRRFDPNNIGKVSCSTDGAHYQIYSGSDSRAKLDNILIGSAEFTSRGVPRGSIPRTIQVNLQTILEKEIPDDVIPFNAIPTRYNKKKKNSDSHSGKEEEDEADDDELDRKHHNQELLRHKDNNDLEMIKRSVPINNVSNNKSIAQRPYLEDKVMLKLAIMEPVFIKSEGYVLEFGNCSTMSSTKNFQLINAITRDSMLLQLGKTDDARYILYFQYPLSPLQAFAIALCSLDCSVSGAKVKGLLNRNLSSFHSDNISSSSIGNGSSDHEKSSNSTYVNDKEMEREVIKREINAHRSFRGLHNRNANIINEVEEFSYENEMYRGPKQKKNNGQDNDNDDDNDSEDNDSDYEPYNHSFRQHRSHKKAIRRSTYSGNNNTQPPEYMDDMDFQQQQQQHQQQHRHKPPVLSRSRTLDAPTPTPPSSRDRGALQDDNEIPKSPTIYNNNNILGANQATTATIPIINKEKEKFVLPSPKATTLTKCIIRRMKPNLLANPIYHLYNSEENLMLKSQKSYQLRNCYPITSGDFEDNRITAVTNDNYFGKLLCNNEGSEYQLLYSDDLNTNRDTLYLDLCAIKFTPKGYPPGYLPRAVSIVIPSASTVEAIQGGTTSSSSSSSPPTTPADTTSTNALMRKPAWDCDSVRKLQTTKEYDETTTYMNAKEYTTSSDEGRKNSSEYYTLDFEDRVVKPSMKNTVIVYDSYDITNAGIDPTLFLPGDILLQFGKLQDNMYMLDFQYPLSPLQAFAIALSILESKVSGAKIRGISRAQSRRALLPSMPSQKWVASGSRPSKATDVLDDPVFDASSKFSPPSPTSPSSSNPFSLTTTSISSMSASTGRVGLGSRKQSFKVAVGDSDRTLNQSTGRYTNNTTTNNSITTANRNDLKIQPQQQPSMSGGGDSKKMNNFNANKSLNQKNETAINNNSRDLDNLSMSSFESSNEIPLATSDKFRKNKL